MDNVVFVTLVFWPAVVLLCAGINMLISWTFSWPELIFDLFIGFLAGYFLYAGAQPDPHAAVSFFFVFSHGVAALAWTLTGGFMDRPENFLWAMAGLRLGATVWAAAWDYVSAALGARLGWAAFGFSLVVAPVKMAFSIITSAVGVLIWLGGLAWAIFGKGKAGFAGGVLFTEFGPGGGGFHATTVGWTMHTWHGNTPFRARAVPHPPVHLHGRLADPVLVPGHDLGRRVRRDLEQPFGQRAVGLRRLGRRRQPDRGRRIPALTGKSPQPIAGDPLAGVPPVRDFKPPSTGPTPLQRPRPSGNNCLIQDRRSVRSEAS